MKVSFSSRAAGSTAGLLRLLSSATQQMFCPRKHGSVPRRTKRTIYTAYISALKGGVLRR
jgi:hypothetical protein